MSSSSYLKYPRHIFASSKQMVPTHLLYYRQHAGRNRWLKVYNSVKQLKHYELLTRQSYLLVYDKYDV